MISALLSRLASDRYCLREHPEAARWNACCDHFVGVVRELQMTAALRELRDAPALDLRLRDALIWGPPCSAILHEQAAEARSPAASPDAGELFDLGGES